MSLNIREILEHVASWPQEDQEELAAYAREIEARRNSVYESSPEELRAIDEAFEQVARGDLASEAEIEAAFARFRHG